MLVKLKNFLAFCNVLDYNGNLSISNLSVIALISKLVITSNPDIATVGVTAVSILNYMHKRSSNAETGSSSKESSDSPE